MEDTIKQLKHENTELNKRLRALQSDADEREENHQTETDRIRDLHEKKLKVSSERFAKEVEDLKLSPIESKGQLKPSQAAGKKLKLELHSALEANNDLKTSLNELQLKYDLSLKNANDYKEEYVKILAEINSRPDHSECEKGVGLDKSLFDELSECQLENHKDDVKIDNKTPENNVYPILEETNDSTPSNPKHTIESSSLAPINKEHKYLQPPLSSANIIIGSTIIGGIKKHIPLDTAYVTCRRNLTSVSIADEVETWTPSPLLRSVVYFMAPNDLEIASDGNMKSDGIEKFVKTVRDKFTNALLTICPPVRHPSRIENTPNGTTNMIREICSSQNVMFSDPNAFICDADLSHETIKPTKNGIVALAKFAKNLLHGTSKPKKKTNYPKSQTRTEKRLTQKTQAETTPRNTEKSGIRSKTPLLPTPNMIPSLAWNQPTTQENFKSLLTPQAQTPFRQLATAQPRNLVSHSLPMPPFDRPPPPMEHVWLKRLILSLLQPAMGQHTLSGDPRLCIGSQEIYPLIGPGTQDLWRANQY